MGKLHELLAVEGSLKAQAEKVRTDLADTFEKKRHLFSEKRVTFSSSEEAKRAAEVLLPALAPVADELDPDSHGGAMLLGVDGVCIISHGSSSARAIVNAVRVANDMVERGLVGALRDAVGNPVGSRR